MASEPISVAVRRGGIVEAIHRYHAVAVKGKRVLAAAGTHDFVSFLRSSAKPFQALELVRARDDLETRDIAIASASHRAELVQIAAVRALLQKANATEDDLECGPQEGRPPGRIYHNCSGKHAGMLATCHARGWRTEGYRLSGHRMQRTNQADVIAASGVPEDSLRSAVDGCGVVTWALPLDLMALMFSRLESSDEGARVATAMRTMPEMVGGQGSVDTELMRLFPGLVAKGGAEGLLCAGGPDGFGLALKAEDGTFRGIRPALAAFLGPLGYELPSFEVAPVLNSRGEQVGEISSL